MSCVVEYQKRRHCLFLNTSDHRRISFVISVQKKCYFRGNEDREMHTRYTWIRVMMNPMPRILFSIWIRQNGLAGNASIFGHDPETCWNHYY